MPSPKIIPVSSDRATTLVDAAKRESNYIPPKAATFQDKNGGTGYRWNVYGVIQSAWRENGKTEGKVDDNITSFVVQLKSLITPGAPGTVPPAGKVYFLRMRVDWTKYAAGDEATLKNYGRVLSILTTLGGNFEDDETALAVIASAFPDAENKRESTIKDMRLYVSVSQSPPKENRPEGYFNMDGVMDDPEAIAGEKDE